MCRAIEKPDLTVVDGSTILRVVNWPTKGKVSDFIENVCCYMIDIFKEGNINVVFDRYYDYNIKSSARAERGNGVAPVHKIMS